MKRKPNNYIALDFLSRSVNEGFARTAVAAFAAQMDPTLDELGDIKTAVSEAVTNAIVHAYPDSLGKISVRASIFEDNLLEITARQLHERFEFQKTAYAKQFPLLMQGLWVGSENLKPNDTIAPVINQGTLGIGFIGLAECLIALTGKHHGESEKSQELGLKIVSYMRDRINEFSERYQHNYSVLATPAEGLSGRFTKYDKKKFGILPGITDKDYYTNSNHVPVYYHCSALKKAQIEAPYHEITRGGHIFYVEIDGDATHNPEAVMKIVDLMDEYNIGYGSVNHTRNRCLDCGYENADKNFETCPKCGSSNVDRLQRITGYLVGTTDRWNKAKLAELNDRVVHD
jgi:ribonucleoside-triphosphate reductase